MPVSVELIVIRKFYTDIMTTTKKVKKDYQSSVSTVLCIKCASHTEVTTLTRPQQDNRFYPLPTGPPP